MSSNYKLTETQFVAIYKLKFYKNKKNWKLYEDVKKEPPQPPPSPTKLNKTYDVNEYPEQDYDMEQVSAHNKAFLHEEPEDAPDAPPIESESKSLPAPPQPLYRPRSWPSQVWGGDGTEAPWQGPQQEWCGVEAEGVHDDLAYDQCDGPLSRHNVWAPAPQLDLNPASDAVDPRVEYLTPAQMQQSTQEWLNSHGYPATQEQYADTFEEYGLMDDSDDFVRGAHLAPHSSEIDLSSTQECACTCNSPCSLSSSQLSRSIQRHRATLSLLLDEMDIRDRLVRTSGSVYCLREPADDAMRRNPTNSNYKSPPVLSTPQHFLSPVPRPACRPVTTHASDMSRTSVEDEVGYTHNSKD